MAAPLALRSVRSVHERFINVGFADSRESRTAIVLLSLAVLHHLHPFAFSLDIGMVWQQLKVLRESVFLMPERGDGLTLLHWTLASALLSTASSQQVSTRRILCLLMGLAFAAELSQFVIRARIPGFHDMFIAAAGIVTGLLAAGAKSKFDADESSYGQGETSIITASLFLFWLTMAWDTFHPFRLEAFHGISWMPFAEHYSRTTFATLSDAMELLLAGLAVSIVLDCFAQRRAAKNLAAWLFIASYALMELSQAWISGRYAGTGDVIALGAGVWLGLRLGPGLLQGASDRAHPHAPSGNP